MDFYNGFTTDETVEEGQVSETCYVGRYTHFRVHFREGSTCTRTLEAESYYYIMVAQREHYGGDYVNVGVEIPSAING